MEHPYHVRVFRLQTTGDHVGEYRYPENSDLYLEEWLGREESDGYHLDSMTALPDTNGQRVVTKRGNGKREAVEAHDTAR